MAKRQLNTYDEYVSRLGIRGTARAVGMPESTLRSRIAAKAASKKGDQQCQQAQPKNNLSRVLVIGDTHCPGMREDYPDFLKSIYDKWGCNRVVHIGDLIDCHALSFHGKDPNLPAVKGEFKRARNQIAQLYSYFPKVDWLLGNHCALAARRASDAGLPDDILRPAAEYWGVPGWTVHPRFHRFEIDGVIYSHGETGTGGLYAAISQSKANFQSVVIGHFHQAGGVWWTANYGHRVFGMSVGTGMDWKLLQFSYGHKFANKPVLGCGVVIEGTQAYFEPMPL